MSTQNSDNGKNADSNRVEDSENEFKGTPEHGGNVWSAARRLSLEVPEVLDLSASLNPLGPPAGLRDRLGKALDLICHYPDRQNSELRASLAKSMGLKPQNILPGNGSTALIRLLARAMDLRLLMVVAPSFGEFSRSLAIAGRHFHYHLLSERHDFVPSVDDFQDIWQEEPTCLILTNPLSTSGLLWSEEVLDWLLDHIERRHGWLIVDEAFIDFAPEKDRQWVLPKLKDHPHLLVLRSLTKFYCLAGLRLGCLLGHEATIAELAPLGEPWSVNSLAQAAGCYCLEQEKYAADTRRLIAQWREMLVYRLESLGLYVFPGHVNFVLVRLPQPGPKAAQVASACFEKGVLLRDCANFPGCTPYHLRIAVPAPEDHDRLFEALEPALKGS